MTEDTQLNVLKLLEENRRITPWQLASELGFSLGKVNYCLNALVGKGLVKANNFKTSANKRAYVYALTPRGLEEKARISVSFLKRKLQEQDALKVEIEQLQRELGPEQAELILAIHVGSYRSFSWYLYRSVSDIRYQAMMKIAAVCAGCLGLAQHNEAVALDINAELEHFLKERTLNLVATTERDCVAADCVIVATATDCARTNYFDATSVQAVVSDASHINPDATILIKSPIPVGYTRQLREQSGLESIMVSAELLL